jgi:phage/conjugal plasmid C-4 type zinc finger TraR family protein
MADFADRASALSEQYLTQALAARAARSAAPAESAIECEECGDEIPEKRRQAVPGCTRCIECQADFDRVSGLIGTQKPTTKNQKPT